MKSAHAAEGQGMDVELYITGPAQRHCMAAIRNSNFHEMGLVPPKLTNIACSPVHGCDHEDELETVDAYGCVPVPQGAGLGVAYDRARIRR